MQGDCYGDEKVRRIRERLTLADYGTIYAYGDTEDDRAMLDLADRKYFRWQEVHEMPAASPETRRCHGGILSIMRARVWVPRQPCRRLTRRRVLPEHTASAPGGASCPRQGR